MAGKGENMEVKGGATEAAPDSSNMVEVHEASVGDLDAALESAQAEEAENPIPYVDPKEPEVSEPESTENPEEGTAPQVDQTTPGDGTEVATSSVAEPSKPAVEPGKVQGDQAEIERLKKQRDQKELLLQHRGNEIGELRKQAAEKERRWLAEREALLNGLRERYETDAPQAHRDQNRIDQIDSEIAKNQAKIERAERIAETQALFLRNIDTEKVTPTDIAEMFRAEGMDERYVAQFMENPWEFVDRGETLVEIGKRAAQRKEYVTADNDRRVLARYCIELEKQVQQLKGKPRQVMQTVQRHLNSSPVVTASSSASPKAQIQLDRTKMSIKQLDEALEHAMRH